MNLGILGCSEIAFRRFMPAVQQVDEINVKVVAEEYAPEKLKNFCDPYGIQGVDSFQKVIDDPDLDAIYIPLPPALHYEWAVKAIESGKHVLVEKPSTTSLKDSARLVELAKEHNVALHENYMFIYHSQISKIREMISSGEIGDIRFLRTEFMFPMRAQNDFRFNKKLGGGALLDAGGYPIRLASMFLGKQISVTDAHLYSLPDFDVDMYGNAVLQDENGITCQVAFGMDCAYRCALEITGSKGRIFTNRIFSAPVGFTPVARLEQGSEVKEIELEADDTFYHSIKRFCKAVQDEDEREQIRNEILMQARLVQQVREKGASE